jgi:hypothetical protein
MTQENSRKRLWITWGGVGGAISFIILSGFILGERNIQKCNAGDAYACSTVSGSDSNRITNKGYLAKLEREKQRELARIKREEVEAKKREAIRQQLAAAAAKEKAEEEKKFKAEGWWEASNGVYLRWCTDANPCPGNASDHYTSSVWRAMAWCKERACGDIYARMNISSGGAVIGWTNDTAYGDFGEKVVLTFGSHLSGQGEIVEFLARG